MVTTVLFIGCALAARVVAQVRSQDNNIAVMDNCDPADPGWNPLGGCSLRGGTVSVAEFIDLLFSPLAGTTPVGHPSWRNEPSYIATRVGRMIRATNWGGRAHTVTRVAEFGGGFISDLNGSLAPAPECLNVPDLTILAPGETEVIARNYRGELISEWRGLAKPAPPSDECKAPAGKPKCCAMPVEHSGAFCRCLGASRRLAAPAWSRGAAHCDEWSRRSEDSCAPVRRLATCRQPGAVDARNPVAGRTDLTMESISRKPGARSGKGYTA